MECGDGVHGPEAEQYGTWMIAPVEDWHPQSSGERFKAPPREVNWGGRGGGKDVETRKRSSEQTTVDEANREEPKDSRSEQLAIAAGGGLGEEAGQLVRVEAGKGTPPSPVKPPLSKKLRKGDPNNGVAGSEMERR